MRRYDVIFIQQIRDENQDVLQDLQNRLNTRYIFRSWTHMVTFGHLWSLLVIFHRQEHGTVKNGRNAWIKVKIAH